MKRKNTDDRRVRLVELTAKGRDLISRTFRVHAAAMEKAVSVLPAGPADVAGAPEEAREGGANEA